LSVSNIAFAEFEYMMMHYICWIWIYDDAFLWRTFFEGE